MKVEIDLGKLLDYYDRNGHDYDLSYGDGFRAFVLDFIVDEKRYAKSKETCDEDNFMLYEMVYSKREDAEQVLANMKKVLKDEGIVTVADYYRLSNQARSPSETYKNIQIYKHKGWFDLSSTNTFVYSYDDGYVRKWQIHLPEPISIEYR